MRLRNRTIVAEATVAHSPRVSIDSLPNEILYRIIQFVGSDRHESYSAFHHTSREPLLHAALVCRRWRHPAQEALFGWVIVSLRMGARPDPWLSLPATSHERVRMLSILETTVNRPGDDVLPCAAALSHSPSIHTFHISSVTSYWRHLCHLPALKDLRMSFWTHPNFYISSSPPLGPFPFQLERLGLGISHSDEDDTLIQLIPEDIVPLLTKACQSLKSLRLEWSEPQPPETAAEVVRQLQPILDASAITLRHLSLHLGSTLLPASIFTAMETITQCVHLEITTIRRFLSPGLEALARSGLCDSLERLTIHYAIDEDETTEGSEEADKDTLPPTLLDILQSPPFAKLRHLIFPEHYWSAFDFDRVSTEITDNLFQRGVGIYMREDLPLY